MLKDGVQKCSATCFVAIAFASKNECSSQCKKTLQVLHLVKLRYKAMPYSLGGISP